MCPNYSLVPRPIPNFSTLHTFQYATLKSWVGIGPGNEAIQITHEVVMAQQL